MSIETKLREFAEVAANPGAQLAAFKAAGRKVIGVMPYYVPDEIIFAAGMVPMGLWGSNTKTIGRAKEYCATFYCSLAQLDVEMLLDGTLDQLDGVVTPTLCDTLRPMSQNIKVAVGDKLPVLFLAHPQSRFNEAGRAFCLHQYKTLKTGIEKIGGAPITDDALWAAIEVYNRARAAHRTFVRLAGEHPEAVSAVQRSAVLKAVWFMERDVYAEKLTALNRELEALPPGTWRGAKVVTTGIICDNPDLLRIFDENKLAIAADDVAHESRAFRTDVPEGGNPMEALTAQWANTGCDSLLFDPEPRKHTRSKHLIKLVRESGARGVIHFATQFCDPEEMDFPLLKNDFDIAGIPLLRLGLDQQMRDFGQISTSLQAFAHMLAMG